MSPAKKPDYLLEEELQAQKDLRNVAKTPVSAGKNKFKRNRLYDEVAN